MPISLERLFLPQEMAFAQAKAEANLEKAQPLAEIKTYDFEQNYIVDDKQIKDIFIWLTQEYGLVSEDKTIGAILGDVKRKIKTYQSFNERIGNKATIFKSIQLEISDNQKKGTERRFFFSIHKDPYAKEDLALENPEQNFVEKFEGIEKATKRGFNFTTKVRIEGGSALPHETSLDEVIEFITSLDSTYANRSVEDVWEYLNRLSKSHEGRPPSGLVINPDKPKDSEEPDRSGYVLIFSTVSDDTEDAVITLKVEVRNKFIRQGVASSARPFVSEEAENEAKAFLSEVRERVS